MLRETLWGLEPLDLQPSVSGKVTQAADDVKKNRRLMTKKPTDADKKNQRATETLARSSYKSFSTRTQVSTVPLLR
jgi:hypothetical protein